MKILLALFMVASLGCDDEKSSKFVSADAGVDLPSDLTTDSSVTVPDSNMDMPKLSDASDTNVEEMPVEPSPCEDPESDRGDGTLASPFVICSESELLAISEDPAAHYELGADIAMVQTFVEAAIPLLEGTLDGGGYQISNLQIDGGNSLGLFARIADNASVRDLSLADVSITGNDGLGALTAILEGDLERITLVRVSVTGRNLIGGLAGQTRTEVTVERVRGDVEVVGRFEFLGGLFGSASEGNYRNIVVTGSVSSNGATGVGGIVGRQSSVATFTDVHFEGDLSGFQSVGGITGRHDAVSYERVSTAGTISASRQSGGISGTFTDSRNPQRLTLTDVSSTIDFVVEDNDRSTIFAGLIAIADGIRFQRVQYSGTVTATNIDEFQFAGLVGLPFGSVNCANCFAAFETSLTNVTTAEIASAVWTAPFRSTITQFYWDQSRTGTDICVMVNGIEVDPECVSINQDGSVPDYWSDNTNPPMNSWDFSDAGPWELTGSMFPSIKKIDFDD